jgi:hypothetical protein
MKLTKEQILKGKGLHETFRVEAYGDADVAIRPLTDGELGQVFALLGSIPLKSDGTPDSGQVDIAKNFQALRLVTSLGLVDPVLTPEEVGAMKFGVPEIIGTRILELSGISPAIKKKS